MRKKLISKKKVLGTSLALLLGTGIALPRAEAETVNVTGDSSSNIAMAEDTTYNVESSNSFTYSGIISGNYMLGKSGTGTLQLYGNNTYTGGTVINGGTLAINSASSLGAASGGLTFSGGSLRFDAGGIILGGNISLDGTGTVDTQGNASYLTGDISGTGGFVKEGAGALFLSGTNTYTGRTEIRDGNLRANLANTLSASSLHNIASGASLNLGGYDQTIGGLSGSGAVYLNSSKLTVNQGTDTTFSGSINGATGIPTLAKSGAGGLMLSGYLDPFVTLDVTGSDGHLGLQRTADYTLQNKLTGGGRLLIDLGSNALTIGSFVGNAFTGTMELKNTALALDSQAEAVLTNAKLQLSENSTASLSASRTIGGLIFGGGSLRFDADNINLDGNISLAGTGTVDTQGNASYLTGDISGTGGFVKEGAGDLYLSGTNTYTGRTEIRGGSLLANSANTLSASSLHNIASVAFLHLNGNDQTIGGLTGSGAVFLSGGKLTVNQDADTVFSGSINGGFGTNTLAKSGAGGLMLSGYLDPSVTLDVTGSDGHLGLQRTADYTLQNKLTGGGRLLINLGSNALTIGSSVGNAFTGTLDLKNTALALDSQAEAVLANASLQLSENSTASLSASRNIGGLIFGGGSLRFDASAIYLGGNISLAGTGTVDTNGNNSYLTGDISGTGGFVKEGTGVLFLSGTNNYSGRTEIRGGSLWANSANALSASSSYDIASGAILNLSNFDQTIGGLTGSGTVYLSDSKLTVNQGTDTVFSGSINEGSGINNTLAKSGAGGLMLSGYLSSIVTLDVTGSGYLGLQRTANYTLANKLTGGGRLLIDLGSNALTIGSSVGNAFTGTMDLKNTALVLDSQAEAVLTNASLQLSENSKATLDADRDIDGLIFGGGTLNLDDNILTVNELNLQSGGTVQVDPGSISSIIDPAKNIFDYADNPDSKAVVKATTVTGGTGQLNIKDQNGDPITQGVEKEISGGKLYFGVTASVENTASQKGIYLGYGIDKIEAYAGQTVTLDSSSSTAPDPRLTAGLTGSGSFTFTGSQDVTVGSSTSNYTGITTIDGLKVTATANKAFGNTSLLRLINGGAADLGGHSISVGGLSGESGTNISLGTGGSLTVEQSGEQTFAGSLTGAGSLVKKGTGTLILTGDNTYTGGTTIAQGILSIGDGGTTGSVAGPIANNSMLIFNRSGDHTQTGAVTGTGQLYKENTNKLTLANVKQDLLVLSGGSLVLTGNLELTNFLELQGGKNFTPGSSVNLPELRIDNRNSMTATYNGSLDLAGKKLTFNLDPSTSAGDTLLTMQGGALGLSDSTQLSLRANTLDNLSEEDVITLVDKTTGSFTQNNYKTIAWGTGASIYDFGVHQDVDTTALLATFGGFNEDATTEVAKAYSEGKLAGMNQLHMAAELITNQAMNNAWNNETGTNGFFAFGGGKSKAKTGSHIDSDSFNLAGGISKKTQYGTHTLLTAAYLEGGWGGYDTYNSFSTGSVHGEGDAKHYGLGLLIKRENKDGLYLEGSLRGGRVETDFSTHDMGTGADFDSKSTYWGAHLGLGRAVKLKRSDVLDTYLKLFYTRQGSDSLTTGANERLDFDSVDSTRLRLGTRYTKELKEKTKYYAGLAWEYEFSGKQKATINGMRIDAPEMKGSSALIELGIQHEMSEKWTIDLSATGMLGKREGIAGSLSFGYRF